jgi:hypothetical protein
MSDDEREDRVLRQVERLLELVIRLLEERLERPTYPKPTGMQITVRS